ncbi:hypothetical protein [Christiangramia salexigens]|uniref:PKD/Chitinase domain-containing protein n=1 Tax=Christiangramia salexigens TaxID=1913577 RepID=A0A1L3J6D3_9FLAO|nr:hypothetical protein [Christiangramia salexigens]APG60663.1 hypothetical protein LPB144_09720 [Christiangramia salexigens]
MRILQFLAVLAISLLCFTACDEEEITNYAFQDISAPVNVTADFEVTQDDTGTVTITPSGEGASMFQVYFGDTENETATEISAGDSLTHVYAEGEYFVRVVAISPSGLTSEFNQRLTISFRKPENLLINIDQPASNPAKISLSASADYATLFEVYFGDVDDEEPTQLMPNEAIEYTYETPGVYLLRVVAKGAGAATIEKSMIVTIPEPSDPLKLPISFDNPLVNYAAIGTFNGAEFSLVTNPDLSGANSEESMVGELTNSGSEWEGVAFALGEPVDFSGDAKKIDMKMWSEVEISVLLKFEGGVNDARANEVKITHPGNGWEDLTFDFGTDAVKSFIDGSQGVGEPFVPTGQYETMVVFVDGGGFTAGKFYFDNVMQKSELPDCTAETEENIDPANGAINWTFKTDDLDHSFDGFGNVAASITRNPVTDGINQSCNVGKIVKNDPCEVWAGIGKGLQTSMDFTSTDKKVFTLKVLAENQVTDVTLRLEFEPHPNVDPAEERVAQITEVGVWQELTFDFSDVDDKTFKSIILYFERGAACDGDVYYIDDLKQTDGTAAVIADPTAAAPTPTVGAGDVKSIFSDTYDDPANVNYFPNWNQSTTYEMVDLNGNAAIKYSNANYQGIDIGENIDASAFQTVHIDVWSGDYTSIPFFLISSTGEKSVSLDVTPNQWNSIEIPLSEFTSQGLSINDVFQFKFDVQPDNGGTFYIDNLYFHN